MSKATKAITCQAYEKIKLMRQIRINCRETQGTKWYILGFLYEREKSEQSSKVFCTLLPTLILTG